MTQIERGGHCAPVQPEDVLPGPIDANLETHRGFPAEDVQAFAAHLFPEYPTNAWSPSHTWRKTRYGPVEGD